MPDNQPLNSTRTPAADKKEKGRHIAMRLAFAVLLLAVAVLGVLLYLAKQKLIFRDPPEPTPAPVLCRAVCYTPKGEPMILSVEQGGTLRLPTGDAIEHYTFIGWADEKGNLLDENELTLYTDASFSARYAIAFRDERATGDHEPYLSLDSKQMFRPHAPLRRSEAVEILYSILDTDAVGNGGFADVDPSDSFYTAAATLKDLGVLGGSKLHPKDAITRAEFFEMLSHFFPHSAARYRFENIAEADDCYSCFCLAMEQGWIDDPAVEPHDALTRAEAAHVFNALRGRSPVVETDHAKTGTILDVSFRDPYFWDIAEACTPHEAETGADGEHWLSSTPQPLQAEGFFFIGTELHYADSEGSPLVNESYGNFDFGPDGVITTGMPELDVLVQEKLRQLVDPATMEPEVMLRRVYDNVTYHSNYLRGGIHEIGETGWEVEAAYRMLHDGKGNCYGYAGTFAVLARALGFDAICYSGTIGVSKQPHGWVEISFDGVPYVFDTNIECEEHIFLQKSTCMYKLPPERYKGWKYVKEAPETQNAAA